MPRKVTCALIVLRLSTALSLLQESESGGANIIFEDYLPELPQNSYLHPDMVHVAVVACGDRLPETLIAVKAIPIMATDRIVFHIFSEDVLMQDFADSIDGWPATIRKKFQYILHPITYPPERFDEWKKLFKTCATQRLFIPVVLRNVDSILYIDTDILFLRPFQDIWKFFSQLNTTQLAAVAPEHESHSAGWYNRFARHPYYGELGINSGVMLMNLTRIRKFSWLQHMNDYLNEYKFNITWGDQDLLNILFHFYPEMVYIYDCSWNYRPDHCMYMSVCKAAEENGISVLHGNRGVLHNDKQVAFKAVYQAFEEHKWSDTVQDLADGIKRRLDKLQYNENGRCQSVKLLFTKRLLASINSLKHDEL